MNPSPSNPILAAGLLFLIATAINGCAPGADAQQSDAPESGDATYQTLESPSGSAYFPEFGGVSAPVVTSKMSIRVDTLLYGDDIEMPWGIAFLPGGITLITERDGNLRIVRGGVLDPSPVTGVPEVYVRGQGGLLDVEAHPDIESNGWIYLSYSVPGEGGGHTAVMRAKLEGGALVSQEVLFSGGPYTRARVHFGSRLQFDRDGYLYFTIGDRGEMKNAQDLNHYSGKLFRIHDDGRIPEDNPFAGRANAKPEIYAYGHRNQQGMALHPVTGRIWTHEHGPQGGDEINVAEPAVNYGWPEITYGINYDGSTITYDTVKAGMAQPVHYWVPSIAPSGMEFISSSRYPGWSNDMIVGALKFQLLARIELDGEKFVKEERFLEGIGRVREVEQGPDGYLYVLTEGPSGLFRILPGE